MSVDDPPHKTRGGPNSILELNDVSVTYDMDRGQARVLDSVCLSIYDQDILGIVGESGSGKSMLASAILDAVPEPGIVGGDIVFTPNGETPQKVLELEANELRNLRWKQISMVFQGAMSSFNPTMKIRTHFKETIKEKDIDLNAGMEHSTELLADLYLEPERVLDSYPHELSGGMKQRALIALSLCLKPNVLVLDEPTAALDLLMQRSILSLLKSVQDKYDLTIIFITHDLPLVAGLCDRLAVLYGFKIVETGPTADIMSDPAHPYTRALLNAVPNLDSPLSEMRSIDGSSPDPVNVPQGCSYHPRCPLADDLCQREDPSMHQVTETHSAACFHWEDAADAIPLSRGDGNE